MPHVKVTARIRKDADALWREVGSFQQVGAWHPMLAKVYGEGEEPGAIRTAETPDGQKQVEFLQYVDAHEHFYRYMMLSTPMPVSEYVGEFRILDEGDGNSTISWSNDFQVTSGDEGHVAAGIYDFLNAGVQNLKTKYS